MPEIESGKMTASEFQKRIHRGQVAKRYRRKVEELTFLPWLLFMAIAVPTALQGLAPGGYAALPRLRWYVAASFFFLVVAIASSLWSRALFANEFWLYNLENGYWQYRLVNGVVARRPRYYSDFDNEDG